MDGGECREGGDAGFHVGVVEAFGGDGRGPAVRDHRDGDDGTNGCACAWAEPHPAEVTLSLRVCEAVAGTPGVHALTVDDGLGLDDAGQGRLPGQIMEGLRGQPRCCDEQNGGRQPGHGGQGFSQFDGGPVSGDLHGQTH